MFTKPDAIKVVCNASKIYHKKLANKNFLVLYKNRSNNAVESLEALLRECKIKCVSLENKFKTYALCLFYRVC